MPKRNTGMPYFKFNDQRYKEASYTENESSRNRSLLLQVLKSFLHALSSIVLVNDAHKHL